MYCSASSTQKQPVLPHQPFLDLDLGAGAERLQQGHARMLVLLSWVSLLTPPALSRCEFASAGSAIPRCHHRRFLCKDGCLVCSWLLLTACREHACPTVEKSACYQQMGEDRWEEWWKVTGHGLNASTSIARLNTMSLSGVTIE